MHIYLKYSTHSKTQGHVCVIVFTKSYADGYSVWKEKFISCLHFIGIITFLFDEMECIDLMIVLSYKDDINIFEAYMGWKILDRISR